MKIIKNKIYNLDCKLLLKNLKNKSVDLILIDPPYNELPKIWDNFNDWKILKEQFSRILKDNGQIYIFGKQPMLSNIFIEFKDTFDFRFELVWNKNKGFWSSNSTPMRSHELIWSFKKKKTKTTNLYFDIESIKTPGKPYVRKNKVISTVRNNWKSNHTIYKDGKRFPLSVINEKPVIRKKNKHFIKHPTEKPISILEWIIKSSCKKNGLVLDCFMGSGSTAIASILNSRNFIGCEIDKNFYKLSKLRIKEINI
tara:strand:- start:73 stop:834 length:762 start_codon:yes stop_codon:yes gene_type:complete